MPLNLETSEVTAQSFRVSWSPAAGNVEMYRVVYRPAQGGEPQEVNAMLLPENITIYNELYFCSVAAIKKWLLHCRHFDDVKLCLVL